MSFSSLLEHEYFDYPLYFFLEVSDSCYSLFLWLDCFVFALFIASLSYLYLMILDFSVSQFNFFSQLNLIYFRYCFFIKYHPTVSSHFYLHFFSQNIFFYSNHHHLKNLIFNVSLSAKSSCFIKESIKLDLDWNQQNLSQFQVNFNLIQNCYFECFIAYEIHMAIFIQYDFDRSLMTNNCLKYSTH